MCKEQNKIYKTIDNNENQKNLAYNGEYFTKIKHYFISISSCMV